MHMCAGGLLTLMGSKAAGMTIALYHGQPGSRQLVYATVVDFSDDTWKHNMEFRLGGRPRREFRLLFQEPVSIVRLLLQEEYGMADLPAGMEHARAMRPRTSHNRGRCPRGL
jgi:hypothetical protein